MRIWLSILKRAHNHTITTALILIVCISVGLMEKVFLGTWVLGFLLIAVCCLTVMTSEHIDKD